MPTKHFADPVWVAVGVLQARFKLEMYAAHDLLATLAELADRSLHLEARAVIDEIVPADRPR